MPIVALGVWLLAAGVGVYLFFLWFGGTDGTLRQSVKVTRYPVTVTFSHPVLAVTGLALWAGYLITGYAGYAWGALLALTVVSLLGFAMVTRWLGGGRHARGGGKGFPKVAVLLHGLMGVTTFVLVVLTTSGLGR
ncbi:hypothetical protein [Acrocarpospora catenulata]|uniref:hypothetical protein n=1 Tax=Acrocarpospora catenulata TaxID=2836182 RepID=UPI001BD9DA4C|nr:hypothetical protein [Acrocarpospora catenulata]